jgi:hypothetical protein
MYVNHCSLEHQEIIEDSAFSDGFRSVSQMLNIGLGRKDDLESLLYTLIWGYKGLLWEEGTVEKETGEF